VDAARKLDRILRRAAIFSIACEEDEVRRARRGVGRAELPHQLGAARFASRDRRDQGRVRRDPQSLAQREPGGLGSEQRQQR
jgi:hypothetical protein